MKGAGLRWFNSIHAYVVATAAGTLIGTIAVSYAYLYLAVPPPKMPVSLQDLVRVVRSEQFARGIGPILRTSEAGQPTRADLSEEPRLSRALAERLGLPLHDVEVLLSWGDIRRLNVVAKDAELYRQFEASDPLVLGSFAIAVRQRDGRWQVLSRNARNPSGEWGPVSRNGLAGGFLIAMLLSLILSERITRPIRGFAGAAERLSGGRDRRSRSPVRTRSGKPPLPSMRCRPELVALSRSER